MTTKTTQTKNKLTRRSLWHRDVDFRRLETRGQGSEGAVDQHVAQVVEQLLGAVLWRLELEELRVLVNEGGVYGAIQELLILQDVEEERNVCLEERKDGK